jgi:hypothetical protein
MRLSAVALKASKGIVMRLLSKSVLLLPLAALPMLAQQTFNFSTPVQTVPTSTDTPGKWYVDRYPPHAFVSPVTAPDGTTNTLEESINAADSNANRPPAFSSNFFSTQGYKFDAPPNTLSSTIYLYVPSDWATQNQRKAGFWLTVFDTSSSVGDFPIIEFEGPTTSDLGGPAYRPQIHPAAGFYGWNNVNGSFDPIGLPPGFTYNSWVKLTITLVPGSNFVYTVSTLTNAQVSINSPLFDANDSYVGNSILEGYNYGTGFDYNIFWSGAFGASSTNPLLSASWWYWYVI